MKPESLRRLRPWLVCLSSAAALSCSHGGGHRSPPPTPVFVESERNDSAFEANYFGVLRAGDRLIIEGDITDIPFDPFNPFNGYDPYDGFAFTAGEPLHVEFALYADRAGADLDVCIYDPQLGLEVGCFATATQPERGAVDVLAGGFDFHLVVQSFAGISSYALELAVYRLRPSTAAPEGGARAGAPLVAVPEAAATALSRSGTARPASGLLGYTRPRADETERSVVERVEVYAIDPHTGATTSSSFFLFSDGTWMGIPGEAEE